MGRLDLTHTASAQLEVRAGTDVTVDRFQLRLDRRLPNQAEFERFFRSRDDLALGGWTELVLRPERG